MPRPNCGSSVKFKAPSDNRGAAPAYGEPDKPAFLKDYTLKINASYTDPTTNILITSPSVYLNGRTYAPKMEAPKTPPINVQPLPPEFYTGDYFYWQYDSGYWDDPPLYLKTTQNSFYNLPFTLNSRLSDFDFGRNVEVGLNAASQGRKKWGLLLFDGTSCGLSPFPAILSVLPPIAVWEWGSGLNSNSSGQFRAYAMFTGNNYDKCGLSISASGNAAYAYRNAAAYQSSYVIYTASLGGKTALNFGSSPLPTYWDTPETPIPSNYYLLPVSW